MFIQKTYNNKYQHQTSSLPSNVSKKFVDLFAGLGGFHVGLSRLGMECVLACEIDPYLRQLYNENFGIYAQGDIATLNETEIPAHDVLCAGFPCQPFSLAGKKNGSDCPLSGKLITHIIRILRYCQPNFIMLENVPNILSIQNGQVWQYICKSLEELGYSVDYRIMSPHEYGLPQKRQRLFVLGSKIGLEHFSWPVPQKNNMTNLSDIISNTSDCKQIENAKMNILQIWQRLLNQNIMRNLSNVSIVAPEFGATYPFDFSQLSLDEIKKYKGAFGFPLENCKSWKNILSLMPHYVLNKKSVPHWMLKSVQFSRKMYLQSPKWLDDWKQDLIGIHNSWQKLEWRGRRDRLELWQHIIQFRASGIRISKTEYIPSLISMTPTQVPIIGYKKRYLAIEEAAKLQSLDGLNEFPQNFTKAFKALGNAVNAMLVRKSHKIW